MTAAEQARDAIARVLWDAVNDGAVALAVPSLRQADALLDSRDPAALAALADHLATVAPDTLLDALTKTGVWPPRRARCGCAWCCDQVPPRQAGETHLRTCPAQKREVQQP